MDHNKQLLSPAVISGLIGNYTGAEVRECVCPRGGAQRLAGPGAALGGLG